MVNRSLIFGWIEAAVRYSGTFGPQEKVIYQQVFGVSEPTTSRHQTEFADQFEAACGADFFKREADGRLSKGRLTLREDADLPAKPVFEKMPELERWLQDALGNKFVEVQVWRSTPKQFIIRSVIQSIWSRVPLRVLYHARSGTRERVISPHAVVKAVGRLHVRAYDHLRNDARDFVLSRIEAASLMEEGGWRYVGAEHDRSWHQFRMLVIEARDNEADAEQRRGVDLDFDLPSSGRREVRTRQPFLQYLVDEMDAGYETPVRIYEKGQP